MTCADLIDTDDGYCHETVQTSASISRRSIRALTGNPDPQRRQPPPLLHHAAAQAEAQSSSFLDTAAKPVPRTERRRDRNRYAGQTRPAR